MNKRQFMVYGIFIVSVIYGAYFHLGGKDKPRKTAPPPEIPQHIEVQTAGFEPMPLVNISDKQDTMLSGWGRNPFQQHESNGSIVTENHNSDSGPAIRLSGISYYPDGESFAVIDNKILQQGDTIDEWQILAIMENSVTVKNAYGVKTIKLGEKN